MATVNAELYDFLKEHETGLTINEYKEVIGYVFIDFCHIKDFIDIVGIWFLDDGGCDCKLQDGYICLEINDILEGEGHLLSDYKRCFNEYDWDNYKDRILEMEKD